MHQENVGIEQLNQKKKRIFHIKSSFFRSLLFLCSSLLITASAFLFASIKFYILLFSFSFVQHIIKYTHRDEMFNIKEKFVYFFCFLNFLFFHNACYKQLWRQWNCDKLLWWRWLYDEYVIKKKNTKKHNNYLE